MDTAVGLFVYKRPEHTARVLEGLQNNRVSRLFVFSDGPTNDSDNIGVEQTRDLIRKIDWCQVDLVESEQNLGLANSIMAGVSRMLETHDSAVILEDDCVPAVGFLSFMKYCFKKYKDNSEVMGVTGYSIPVGMPDSYPYDVYFSSRGSSWGWGTWKRAWKEFHRDLGLWEKIKSDKKIRASINHFGKDLLPMLRKSAEGKNDSWAVYWAIHVILSKGLFVVPTQSLIENIGFDGSGTHCDNSSAFSVKSEDIASGALAFPDTISPDEEIDTNISKFVNVSLISKIRRKISY
ncbi:MAG: hypothetical protein KKA07_16225 [Bacteroidetes bacterium]|nr:hypothetical protein [Bacteroidota bacterium]MBU1720612.1 hypothetical protein [Bacteroidota bacterium]